MINIKLHGKLGKELGKTWCFDAKTPNEALRAINVNTDNRLRKYLIESKENNIAYKFSIEDNIIDSKDKIKLLDGPISKEKTLHVWPVVGGYTPDLFVQIIIAVVLAAVSMILAPTPSIDTGKSNDEVRKDSYLFSGRPTPAKQGMPIPVGYGEMIVFPILVNARYVYDEVESSDNSTESFVERDLSDFPPRMRRNIERHGGLP